MVKGSLPKQQQKQRTLKLFLEAYYYYMLSFNNQKKKKKKKKKEETGILSGQSKIAEVHAPSVQKAAEIATSAKIGNGLESQQEKTGPTQQYNVLILHLFISPSSIRFSFKIVARNPSSSASSIGIIIIIRGASFHPPHDRIGSDRDGRRWRGWNPLPLAYLLILVMAFLSHFTTRELDLGRDGVSGTGAAAEEEDDGGAGGICTVSEDAAMALALALPALLLLLIIIIADASDTRGAELRSNPPSPFASMLFSAVLRPTTALPLFLLCLFRIKVPSSATIMLSAHIRPEDPCLLYESPFFSITMS
jgi:hypothetical protein